MTSAEFNLKLIESFPEIKDAYYEETSWQDGDETGSHIVYADVFVPFLKEQLADKNEQTLNEAFDYIEKMLELNDEYVNEVIALSVLEALLFDEDVENAYFIQFAKSNTLQLIKEIIQSLECESQTKSIYLNTKEERIIGSFMNAADGLEGKLIILKWKDGSQVQGVYDSYMEDESDCDMDDEDYEEFWSFVFKAIDLVGEPPIYITEDEYFCINYHNFPDEIIAGDQKTL